MRRVRFTKKAREDLLELWAFVATRNPAAADRIIDQIEARCASLRDHPELAPARPDIGRGARMLVIRRWPVLYRLTEDGVQIVRMVDGARDLSSLPWLRQGR